MKERGEDEAVGRLLSDFHRAGGAVEFVIIDPEELSGMVAHRAAAVFGLEVWNQRWQTRGSLFKLVTNPERAEGQSVDAAAFFGPPSGGGFAQGFVSAFKEPPHGARAVLENLYEPIVEALGLRRAGLEIVRWSTDWSNYFDAGQEWWGAHLWTIRTHEHTILWIGASSTD